jgi:hypothetical protein
VISGVGTTAVYADEVEEPILTASDATFSEGYVGFGSFDDTGNVRNVKVWAPSAAEVTAPFFAAAP